MAKNKNTGLGRGLDAIFLDNTTEESGRGVTMLRLSDIEPRPDQPRKQFESESLASLADSIAENGVLQPLLVRAEGDGFYQIIAGERRWRASKMAGLTEVPAIITDADDKKAFELAIIENIQRENLNAIEEAAAIRDLMTEYGLTQEEVSTRISRSRSAVSNAIRLLDLPDSVMKAVSDGKLSAGHARALLGLRDSEKIISAAQTVISRGLSVRATEELVRSLNRAQEDAKKPPRGLVVHRAAFMSFRLRCRVRGGQIYELAVQENVGQPRARRSYSRRQKEAYRARVPRQRRPRANDTQALRRGLFRRHGRWSRAVRQCLSAG